MPSKLTLNLGDCFELGQVWRSPKGTLYRAMEYDAQPGKRKQVVLRKGLDGKGQKSKRDWDAVDGWSIYARPLRLEDVPNEPWKSEYADYLIRSGAIEMAGLSVPLGFVSEVGTVAWSKA